MSHLRALHYARAHRQRFVSDLKDFIRFPSISADPKHAGDVERCASWLAHHLRRIGMDVRLIRARHHPLVYASWQGAAGRPTVLTYGHYDVQPVDPLREWRFPPFEPTLRGADLFGRGACDDKGPLLAHVDALEAYLHGAGTLPVNIKCIFEGEEEIGSPSLARFIAQNRRSLAADVAVMSDTRILAPDRPAITYAERGALYLELEVRGPKHDLHSGSFGGAVHNAVQALCEIVSKLHDANGHIAIDGFYDQVRNWSERERAFMARTGPSDSKILHDAESARGWGEAEYTLYERSTLRPALTVNGIGGGYLGPGAKGVIPARAVAKISFRLVPDQDPRAMDQLFRRQIVRLTPPTVSSSVRTLSSAKPVVMDPHQPAMRAAASAYRKGFGAEPVFLRSGGTIPVLSMLQEALHIPTVLMGFALPDDRMHAPNEKFHLPNFYNGISACIWFLAEICAAGAAVTRIPDRHAQRAMALA